MQPNLYETIVIVTPEADQEGVNAVLGDLRTVVENGGGNVLQADVWGRRKLAYRVKKKDEGIFILFHTEGPAELPQLLKQRMRIDESVIRYMVVRLEDAQAEKVREEAATHTDEEAKAGAAQKEAAERRAAAAAEAAAMSAAEAAAAEARPEAEAAEGEVGEAEAGEGETGEAGEAAAGAGDVEGAGAPVTSAEPAGAGDEEAGQRAAAEGAEAPTEAEETAERPEKAVDEPTDGPADDEKEA